MENNIRILKPKILTNKIMPDKMLINLLNILALIIIFSICTFIVGTRLEMRDERKENYEILKQYSDILKERHIEAVNEYGNMILEKNIILDVAVNDEQKIKCINHAINLYSTPIVSIKIIRHYYNLCIANKGT